MLKNIASLLGRERTLNAEMKIDHLELSRDMLTLGVQLSWRNDTSDRIVIRGIAIKLYHKGKKEQPVGLSYIGRFVRIPYQKNITKIAGETTFRVGPGETHSESIRFMTREILDLPEGLYGIDLLSTVPDGAYLHTFYLNVTAPQKFRTPGHEAEATPVSDQARTTTSIFSRALRMSAARTSPSN